MNIATNGLVIIKAKIYSCKNGICYLKCTINNLVECLTTNIIVTSISLEISIINRYYHTCISYYSLRLWASIRLKIRAGGRIYNLLNGILLILIVRLYI